MIQMAKDAWVLDYRVTDSKDILMGLASTRSQKVLCTVKCSKATLGN